jgi:hypothetical protein
MSSTMQNTTMIEAPAWLNVEGFGTEQERADLIAEARAVSESLRHLSPGIRLVRERAMNVLERFEAMVSGVPDDVWDTLREALGVQEVEELCAFILGTSAEGSGLPTEQYLAELQAKYGESLAVE